ncbi:MAG: DUF3060 domain-containing protein [Alphaproteobacteria bacterium]|nr:DUF3060 domain-containing protein [Alphaproteobacteria bacterium]
MPSCFAKGALALVAFICSVGTVTAQTTGNQAGFLSSGQTARLDCNGGKAEIMGSNNKLTITGRCSALDLAGSGNTITIEFAAGATVQFVGSGNTITWTSVDGKAPKITYIGSNNMVKPPPT